MAKTLDGIVVSTKLEKTITVRVEERYRHPLYQKVIKKHKRYLAHNEQFKVADGDTVRIAETRPLSRNKHFKVIEVFKK